MPLKKVQKNRYDYSKGTASSSKTYKFYEYDPVYYKYINGSRHTPDDKNTPLHPQSLVEFVNRARSIRKKIMPDVIIGVDGKEYPKSEIRNVAREQSKIYKELIRLGYVDATSKRQAQNGTIVFGMPAKNANYETITIDGKHYTNWYRCVQSGQVYNRGSQFPVYVGEPVKSIKELDKMLAFVLKKRQQGYQWELKRWKEAIEKGTKSLTQLPYYLQFEFMHPDAAKSNKIRKMIDDLGI
jgi:hypothetical protein